MLFWNAAAAHIYTFLFSDMTVPFYKVMTGFDLQSYARNMTMAKWDKGGKWATSKR